MATTVGGYRLIAKIGEGGMGVVHLAQRPGGARVALKVLRPAIVGDDEGRARLAREVTSLKRIHSPRIAEIVDADPWGETPYVATRYVPGLSLHQHVAQEGPIRGADLRYFAAGLMEAVAAVHQVGVLHRDVKPSNVLLEGRAPVLIDFGLARLAEDPRLTHAGWLLGTPGYLAPEILYGDEATTASDVHAWAATVAFAALGRPPFGGGPAVAVMDRVRRGEHDLSGVPAELRGLLERCLASDAAQRPTTAAVLAELRAPGVVEPDRPTAPYAATLRDPDRTVSFGSSGPSSTSAAPAAPATLREPVTLAGGTATLVAPPPSSPARTQRRSVRRLQRVVALGGSLVAVTIGFVTAPLVTLLVVAGLVQLVRTQSWTVDAARLRQTARGRRRWYDLALTTSTSPWFLVVALGGTLVLFAWALLLSVAVLVAGYLAGLPPLVVSVCAGAVLATAVWWGPGARRLRTPARRLLDAATAREAGGWVLGVVVLGVVAFAGYRFAQAGSAWAPMRDILDSPSTLLTRLFGW